MKVPGVEERRVLIVKLGAIGDVVMTLPAALLLHRSGYAVDWLCGPAVAPILQRYDWIRTIVIDDAALRNGSLPQRLYVLGRLWKRLLSAGIRYELCACFYYDARYRVITWPVRARRSIALSHTDRARMLVPGRHHTDEYARLMLSSLTGQTDGEHPWTLPPVPFPLRAVAVDAPKRDKLRVALCPGGARNALRDDPQRRWPLKHYVELASRLVAAGREVVLIGGPDDTWVRASFAALTVTDHIGRSTLVETITLLGECDALVTHDTGPLHLAGITPIAIVGLFGPTNPRTFLPRREAVVGLWGGEGFACRPCYDGRNFAPCEHNGCLHEISPDAVLAALAKVLKVGAPTADDIPAVPVHVVRRH